MGETLNFIKFNLHIKQEEVSSMNDQKKYKSTLNLPKTSFSMKANLSQREPQIIKKWEQEKIYDKIIESRKDKTPSILHDGPPYANGNIHIGHALNKTLKDIIVKSKTMLGYYSPYVPGWDCHGLPIEHQVMKQLGDKAKTLPLDIIRKKCREYAKKFVKIQTKDFQRLGIFGDYENPYLTMNLSYEADILKALGKLMEKGYIYKGLKPVHWCGHCNTALADAEIEHHDHSSPSIYVKFPIEKSDINVDGKLFILIWTTTPWTLPANVAVSMHPDFEYALAKNGNEYYIMAKDLIPVVAEASGIDLIVDKTVSKKELENLVIKHPFIEERIVKPVFGTHVTLDAGTGVVHTAPGHGVEDYEVGLEYNLDVLAPVDHEAKFTSEVKEWQGMHVFEANPLIIERLKNDGTLLYTKEIEHSYPHCWRCKNPVIFRATPQWFVSVEQNKLRKETIKTCDEAVTWYPENGKNRMMGMLENRPDWCISRQRSWGVPIPAVYCEECGETILTAENIYKVSEVVREEGLDVWFTKPVDHFLGSDYCCPKCKSKKLSKEGDILDVWFDSGVSWYAVLQRRGMPEADVYLEGSDQHRGWFQSSLLTSMGIQDKAPFKEIITHGFILDEEGKAMSKSVGNTVAPEEIIKKYGADIIRLWTVTQNYFEDSKIGDNLLKQTADAYRKIRNTIRFILGNISDFDVKTDSVAFDDLNFIDKWAMSKLHHLVNDLRKAYETYQFNSIFKKIYQFTNLDLSSFYFDILKDLLYTSKKDGKDRRSAQTVMYHILNSITKFIAPILSFTAEEVWEYIEKDSSVHLQYFAGESDFPCYGDIEADIDALKPVREDVLKALEIARGEKKIKASLETLVNLKSSDSKIMDTLKKYESFLPVYFITSEVSLAENIEAISSFKGEVVGVAIALAQGEKCPRCWKVKKDIGSNPNHSDICASCAEAIS